MRFEHAVATSNSNYHRVLHPRSSSLEFGMAMTLSFLCRSSHRDDASSGPMWDAVADADPLASNVRAAHRSCADLWQDGWSSLTTRVERPSISIPSGDV
jgi:hypothetical protein